MKPNLILKITLNRNLRQFAKAALIALGLTIGIIGVAWAADVTIDTFSNQSQTVSVIVDDPPVLPMPVACNFAASTSAIGGHRDVCLEVTEGDADSIGRFRVSAGNQYLALSLENGVKARGFVQWDGLDATSAISPTGVVPSVDLTGGNTNDGILIRVIASDGLPVDITVRIYTDGSNWAQRTFRFQSIVTAGEVVDVFLPFDTFVDQAGTMNETSVGAVELAIDGTIQAGADISLRLVRATSVREYGDLPDSGPVTYTLAIRDAYHIPQGLRLGINVDAEAGYIPNANATADDTNGSPDDEDGVRPSPGFNWAEGANGGHLDVTVNGCQSPPCRLNGWIDWNMDGDFADTGEYILNEYSISNGTYSGSTRIRFDIPAGQVFDTTFYARLRLCQSAGQCNAADDSLTAVVNGEIEDYAWVFGPTAVTLIDLTARSQPTGQLGGLGVLALLAPLSVVAITLRLRYQRARK